jgi:capsular polysaccharide export protein
VPGQVEDDASILRGCADIRTNLALLESARAANPGAWIVYKPHPDVEAGLRAGAVEPGAAAALADEVASGASAADLIDAADAVWTMTSLLGFEALMRGKAVTCLGVPFYAGWGLTTDLGQPVPRRTARPTLDQLVWAALIAYPSYRDPVTGLPCGPELVVERFAAGAATRQSNLLSRLQAVLAGQAWLWRR